MRLDWWDMAKFIFIRHGEADYSHCRARGFMGHGNDLAQLTEKGINQIKQTSEDIRLVDADIIISSPYTRALQSASIIASKLGRDINIEVDVHEWLPDKSFMFKTFEEADAFNRDFIACDGIYPEGEIKLWEDIVSIDKRVKRVLDKYKHLKKVIVVCHEMVMTVATGRSFVHRDEENIINGQILEFDYE
jgi:broad specificity phosphatase PhoE